METLNNNKPKKQKKAGKRFLWLCLLALVLFGVGRLGFWVTEGFHEGNITSDFTYDLRWDTRPLSNGEKSLVNEILSQEFTYLGKGCQSYVFLSKDNKYVLKFFKYQRFRPKFYLKWFSSIPAVENLRQAKIVKKQRKLEGVYSGWKIAFDDLQTETGVLYVHLNKTENQLPVLTFYDKLGITHQLEMDRMEFLIQRTATMLCPELDTMMAKGETDKAKELLTQLLQMVLSEYHRGFADNDHALMQNTGVLDRKPIHVDVGQFVKDDAMRDPENYHQELFNKTYKFRIWLKKYPELLSHLDQELHREMGDKFYQLKHQPTPRG
ncbi:MAG: hypothetical protein K940chlam7_01660 [Chlamydiae bacterium]|nr:hypothetical protein [Chlamydiota bacterium]